jgi:hypothetical protein
MKYKYPIHIKNGLLIRRNISEVRAGNPASLNALPFRFLLLNIPDKSQSGLIPYYRAAGNADKQKNVLRGGKSEFWRFW